MSIARKIITGDSGGSVDPGDPDFGNVSLLLNGDGNNGANNNTFTDSSSNNFPVSATGSVPQGSFSPYGDSWSNFFTGSDDEYIRFLDGSAFDFSTGDFTVECFFYETEKESNFTILGSSTGRKAYFGYGGLGSGGMSMFAGSSGSDIYSGAGSTPLPNQWNHLVWQRRNGRGQMYVNGTRVYDAVYSSDFSTSATGFDVGKSSWYGIYRPFGFISNFRVIKGVGLYDGASITVPTEPLINESISSTSQCSLLTCASNKFEDVGYLGTEVTLPSSIPRVSPGGPFLENNPLDMTTDGGSGYFQSGTRLSISSNTALDVGSKMSAEAWIYVDQLPTGNAGTNGQGVIFSRWTSSGGSRSWVLLLGADGQLSFWFSSNGGTSYSKCNSAVGVITTGQWYHVAVTWDGANQRLFIDGNLEQTTANTAGPKKAVTADFAINAYNTTVTPTSKVYVSDVRFFNNAQNPWIANFTPPSSPVSAGTSAVTLNFQDAGIYDLSGTSDIVTEGAAQITTSVKKYGTGSIDFTGVSSSQLAVKENGNSLTFGTGDFTIETWVYLNSLSVSFLFDWRNTGGNQGARPSLYIESSVFKYYAGGLRISSNTLTGRTGQWLHVALVKYSGQTKLYVNGTQEGLTYTDGLDYIETQNGNLNIGNRVSGYKIDGYMDDIRITKGVARYTANFTPPTEALPTF